MTDWSTLKKLIWLRIIKGGSAVLKTVTGSLIHITDALALPAEALTVNVEPIQAGSGDPSPDNVRPISGRTSATIYHSGADTSNPTTYTIQLGDTVYGGTLDVTGGKMVVDRRIVEITTETTPASHRTNSYGNLQVIYRTSFGLVNFSKVYCNAITPTQSTSIYNYQYANTIGISNLGQTPSIYVCPSSGTTWETYNTWLGAIGTLQVVCVLATPFEITLTPTQIDMLLGTNNLWADAGDSTLTYYADGNASTSEALGILLGGTYNNPGGADDVSDDEALGILLGGS